MANKVSRFFKEQKRTILTGLLFLGLAIALIGLQASLEPAHGVEPSKILRFVLTIIDHASIALFSIAVLGFLLELPHFYSYFHKLILDAITHKEHLSQLTPEALELAQRRWFETFFRIEDLSKEEDFSKFYLEKIRTHIGVPFREKTSAVTIIRRAGDTHFVATDKINYTCRKLGKSIQDYAGWTAEIDEADEVRDFEIIVKQPGGTPRKFPKDGVDTNPPKLVPYQAHGFTLPFTDYPTYHECDRLEIEINVTYVVPIERAFSWSMPCLSHGFSGAIHYPENFDIFVDLFGLESSALPNKAALTKDAEGLMCYPVDEQSWLLPDDGFAFHLRKKPSEQVAVKQQDSTLSVQQ